jgi:hypothetical protein
VYAKNPGEERIDYLIEAAKFEQKALIALDQAGRAEILSHFRKIATPRAYLYVEDPFDQGQRQRVIELLRGAGYPLGPLKKVLSLKLINHAPAQFPGYPAVYARYQNSSADSLLSPLAGRLKAGSEILFSYKSPESRDAALIIGDTFIPLFKNQEGIFELGLKIPKAEKLSLVFRRTGKTMILPWPGKRTLKDSRPWRVGLAGISGELSAKGLSQGSQIEETFRRPRIEDAPSCKRMIVSATE